MKTGEVGEVRLAGMKTGKKIGTICGCLSVALFGIFYIVVTTNRPASDYFMDPHTAVVVLSSVLIVSILCSLVAGFTSTKRWLVVAALYIAYIAFELKTTKF